MKHQWVLVIPVLFLFWFVGFYPFSWQAPSNFQVSTDGKRLQYVTSEIFQNSGIEFSANALQFSRPAIAYSPKPPTWLKEAIETSTLNLNLTVQAGLRQQYGPARIFTISKDPWERNLTLAQDGPDLIIRMRTSDTDLNGIPAYTIREVFSTSSKTHIGLRIGPRTFEVSMNNVVALLDELPTQAFSTWSPDYYIALGNELTFDRPWLGNIYEATITMVSGSVDYSKPGALYAPRHFTLDHERYILLIPFPIERFTIVDSYVDWSLNFIAFFFLGFSIVHLRGHSSSLLFPIAVSALLSMSIEIGQLFFGERYPSTEDLILNIIGGFVGASMARKRAKIT